MKWVISKHSLLKCNEVRQALYYTKAWSAKANAETSAQVYDPLFPIEATPKKSCQTVIWLFPSRDGGSSSMSSCHQKVRHGLSLNIYCFIIVSYDDSHKLYIRVLDIRLNSPELWTSFYVIFFTIIAVHTYTIN